MQREREREREGEREGGREEGEKKMGNRKPSSFDIQPKYKERSKLTVLSL